MTDGSGAFAPRAGHVAGASTGSPRGVAYVALLACSTLGTLASTLLSAPINVIARALAASPRGIVLAVSAFTLAMVVCAPLVGWMCQRFGSRVVLSGSLALMAAAQLGAALTQSLHFLVLMRVLQGIACSAIPPAVQQVLGHHWADRKVRVMAAWATAIGLGQALGPALGGFIADTLGWRAVFVTHAGLSILLLVLSLTVVPAVPRMDTKLDLRSMTSLVVGVGSLVGALTWAGQGGGSVVALLMAGAGLATLAVFGLRARRGTATFVDWPVIVDPRFAASTVAAGTVMGCLGVAIVATPLHLGRDVGLGPAAIGLVVLAIAVSMTVFAPLSSRLTVRFSQWRVLRLGLAVMAVGLVVLPLAAMAGSTPVVLGLTVAALVLVGGGIGIGQATSALGLMTSPAASHGAALGLHNMVRFAGLAVGYSWVALTYPSGHLRLVYAAPVLPLAASWVLAGAESRGSRSAHEAHSTKIAQPPAA
jgi:MFS family permease